MITYKVIGRYMAGSAVTAYHLLGSDNSQIRVTKERLIHLIGKALVDNMRVQGNGAETIVRGKGINLTKLPVYDENKGELRDNPKGYRGNEFKIVKRIMYKTACAGYILQDMNGDEKKVGRKTVVDLALEKLIINAEAKKYRDKNTGKIKIALSGVGESLSNLPIVMVDKQGNITDPNKDIKLRAVRMKKGGILYNKERSSKEVFSSGDYLVCGKNGTIKILKEKDIASRFKVEGREGIAICDAYIDRVKDYQIEIFGLREISIKPEDVSKWQILKMINTQRRYDSTARIKS